MDKKNLNHVARAIVALDQSFVRPSNGLDSIEWDMAREKLMNIIVRNGYTFVKPGSPRLRKTDYFAYMQNQLGSN